MAKKPQSKKTVINITAKQPKAPNYKKTRRPTKSPNPLPGAGNPAWLNAMSSPFEHEAVAVPDQETAASCKATSRLQLTFRTQSFASATDHGIAIAIMPNMVQDASPTTGKGFVCSKGVYDPSLASFVGDVNVLPGAPVNPLNWAAMFPDLVGGSNRRGYSYRCSAMSARLSYMGTELQRAGRIDVGLADSTAGSVANSSNMNGFSKFLGLDGNGIANISVQAIRSMMRRSSCVRNPDGSVEVRWFPRGAPKYERLMATNDNFDEMKPVIIIMITGDLTETGGTLGAEWALDIVQHWEITPISRVHLALQPTPSCYDVVALERTLNAIQSMTTVLEENGMGVYGVPDGASSQTTSAWDSISSLASRLSGTVLNTGQYVTDGLNSRAGQMALRGLAQYAQHRARAQPRHRGMITL